MQEAPNAQGDTVSALAMLEHHADDLGDLAPHLEYVQASGSSIARHTLCSPQDLREAAEVLEQLADTRSCVAARVEMYRDAAAMMFAAGVVERTCSHVMRRQLAGYAA
jgi:hypothetical protein